jgi:hypothetical protein
MKCTEAAGRVKLLNIQRGGCGDFDRSLPCNHPYKSRFSMNENPYQVSQTNPTAMGILSGTRDDLRSVAKSQKGIIVCILIYLVAVIAQFALPPEARPVVGLGVLVVGLASAVFVFMLAIKVYGTGLGIVLGILSLIPCIGLIVLLIVNGKATGILKQNGIKVGLLGANISAI